MALAAGQLLVLLAVILAIAYWYKYLRHESFSDTSPVVSAYVRPTEVDRLAETESESPPEHSLSDIRRWMTTPFTEPSAEKAYLAEGDTAKALPTIPGKSRFGYW